MQFDDGDLGADGVVEVAELAADGAGADDQHATWAAGRQVHGFLVGEDGLAVEVSAWEGRGRAPVAMMMDSAVRVVVAHLDGVGLRRPWPGRPGGRPCIS